MSESYTLERFGYCNKSGYLWLTREKLEPLALRVGLEGVKDRGSDQQVRERAHNQRQRAHVLPLHVDVSCCCLHVPPRHVACHCAHNQYTYNIGVSAHNPFEVQFKEHP